MAPPHHRSELLSQIPLLMSRTKLPLTELGHLTRCYLFIHRFGKNTCREGYISPLCSAYPVNPSYPVVHVESYGRRNHSCTVK